MTRAASRRNNAWVAVRAHARERGRYRQWLDARVLVSLYFQAFLTSPDVDRPPNSSDLWTAWDVAETIAKDAMAVVALGEDSPDSVLAAHLDRLNAPWRAVTGSEDDRVAYAQVVRASGAVEDRPAPDDYEPDVDDYDLSVEDPVIDGDAPVTAEDFRRDAMQGVDPSVRSVATLGSIFSVDGEHPDPDDPSCR